MRGIRRRAACACRIFIILHRIRIRCIDRTYGQRSRDRVSEGEGTVIRIVLPVVKVIAGFILRRGRRIQHRAVRHLCPTVVKDNLVRMRCVCRCRVEHLYRIGVDFPNRSQRHIRSDRASDKLELGSVRCLPVLKVIAVALSRRGGRNACRIVLYRRLRHAVAVAVRLGRGRKAALIRIESNRVARQLIGIFKACRLHIHGRAGRIGVRDGSRSAQRIAEAAATLRHHIGNRVDAGVVAVVLCATRLFLEGVHIGAGHREVEGSARKGSACRRILGQHRGTRGDQREVCARKRVLYHRVLTRGLVAGTLLRGTGRHGFCRDICGRKGGAGQGELKVLREERCTLAVRQEAVVSL